MPFGFEKHVFISYSHLDNQTDLPEKEGWVSQFEKTLTGQLSTRLGEKAKVWRDPTLRGIEDFTEAIVQQFSGAATLISVLSPGYMNSQWCRRELTEFCAAAEKSVGLKIGRKYRLVKIIKLPVDRDQQDKLHPDMSRMLGYEFFIGGKDETAIELDPSENAQLYRVQVAKLAQDIANLIRDLVPPANAVIPPRTEKAAVYLAECAYDRKNDRVALAAELEARGYSVLRPDNHPDDRAAYAAEVQSLLEQASLSLHLVGNGYGAVPDGPGPQTSVVALQNELAIERSRAVGLPRIIWVPEGLTGDNAQQQEFIRLLLNDANAQLGADLLTGGFESLKETVVAALKRLETKPTPNPEPAGQGPRTIHILCEEKDREAVLPIRKFLKGKGFDAKIPVFQGEPAAVREANDKALRECHAVLIFYGAGEETWKRAVDGELLKLPGYRPDKARPPVFTWLAAPLTADKTELLELETDVLNGVEGFAESVLNPLFSKLGSPQ